MYQRKAHFAASHRMLARSAPASAAPAGTRWWGKYRYMMKKSKVLEITASAMKIERIHSAGILVGTNSRSRNHPKRSKTTMLARNRTDRKSTGLNSSHGYISYAV